MSYITDYRNAGAFPLQDWGVNDEKLSLGRRKMMVGCRILVEKDPSEIQHASEGWTTVAKDNDKGTFGDIHPWQFWQTQSREKRDMGTWAMAYAATAGGGGGSTGGGGPITPGGSTGGIPGSAGGGTSASRSGPSVVFPVRNGDWQSDERFVSKPALYGRGFQSIPRGTMLISLPAMSERKQFDLVGCLDPRLFAPASSGPGHVGTIVCDMGPDWEPCMDNSTNPGSGGRQARLQSLVRVIPVQSGENDLFGGAFNAIALNYTYAEQDYVPGYGLVYGRIVDGSPPQTPQGPITGGGSLAASSLQGKVAGSLVSGPSDPGNPFPDGGIGIEAKDVGKAPSEYGKFTRKSQEGFGSACMDAFDAGGIVHCGARSDKHRIGFDKDRKPINSAHISTDANYFRNPDEDGPLLFEGLYPNPGPLPLISRVHLSWNGGAKHRWRGDYRDGYWQWWAEVPYLVPGTPTTRTPPPTGRPGGPTTPGGPGAPGTPGGPGAPGNPGNPGGPATPGAPGAPGAPGTGGGGTPPGGGGPGSPGSAPTAPGGPGGGAGRPRGPITGGPQAPSERGIDERDDRYGPQGGVPAGGGVPPYDPFRDRPKGPLGSDPLDGRKTPPGPITGPRGGIPLGGSGDKGGRRVGGERNKDDKKVSVFFPFLTSTGGTTQRPQKWQLGEPDVLNSVQDLPAGGSDDIAEDERQRPHVVGETPWGSQSNDCWNYAETPQQSNLRGGTANGGVLFHPPGISMDEYLGINSNRNAYVPPSAAIVGIAPGTSISYGIPHKDGGMAAWASRQRQDPTTKALLLESSDSLRNWATISKAINDSGTGDIGARFYGAHLGIPVGDDSGRYASATGGELRCNNTSGNLDYMEWYDPRSSAWVAAAVAPPVPAIGLSVLGEPSGLAGAVGTAWSEIACGSSDLVLMENGGILQWAKIGRNNLNIKVPATLSSEAGDPVRTIGTSSTAEATFTTLTIPGSTLAANGDVVCLEFMGEVTNNSGSSNAMTVRIKVGGVTYYQQAATIATSANRRIFHGRLNLAYRGSNIKQTLLGTLALSGATAATSGFGDFGAAGTAIGGPIAAYPTATASSSNAFAVTLQMDVNSASINAKLFAASLTYTPA